MKNKTTRSKEKKIHIHTIAIDDKGQRMMTDTGWYLCECGAKAFPNTGWIEPETPPSPKDYLTDREKFKYEKLKKFEYEFMPLYFHDQYCNSAYRDESGNYNEKCSCGADEKNKKIEAFLKETIQQSMEVGEEKGVKETLGLIFKSLPSPELGEIGEDSHKEIHKSGQYKYQLKIKNIILDLINKNE